MLCHPVDHLRHQKIARAVGLSKGAVNKYVSLAQAQGLAWPLPEGAGLRADLYNLYHVLNHVNLFGAGYLWLLVDKRKLTWHDRYSETCILRLPDTPRRR